MSLMIDEYKLMSREQLLDLQDAYEVEARQFWDTDEGKWGRHRYDRYDEIVTQIRLIKTELASRYMI